MKLLRVGQKGKEMPAALDKNGKIRDLSSNIKDFNPKNLNFEIINKYHIGTLPYFLDKLSEITEGDATMLDKTMIVYGSPMGDSNLHNHKRCPLIVLGGANARLDGENHINTPNGTPMANAMLSLMHTLGMDHVESFGDSTEALSLSAPVENVS